METLRPAILYIDDEKANLDTFRRAFRSDYLVKTCLSAREALDILANEDFPIIISDQRMPEMTGIELCEKLIELCPSSIRMILTAYTETQLLLDAINRGQVHDYIVKPWSKSEIKPILDKAFEDYKKRIAKLKDLEDRAARSDHLAQQIQEVYNFDSLVGATSGLQKVIVQIKKVAPTDATVLILGETGTGKELLARAIHENSKRKAYPFIPIHCASLAKTVLESELFGHAKGAFTGANETRIGRFEQAKGGTVFLDELAEIPGDIQIKLLRVLQEKEIERVGSNHLIPVDVRILAATNKNLQNEVRAGRFREDLYYRLNVIPMTMPPLRDRREDIPTLANHFLKKFCVQLGRHLELSAEALDLICKYDWPGNVRELQNIMERTVILSSGDSIEAEDLNLHLDEMLQTETIDCQKLQSKIPLRDQIQTQEIKELQAALLEAGGNISKAAKAMGLARSTLFHRLKRGGLI